MPPEPWFRKSWEIVRPVRGECYYHVKSARSPSLFASLKEKKKNSFFLGVCVWGCFDLWGGGCFFDFWPGILKCIIINTWVANPLLSPLLVRVRKAYHLQSSFGFSSVPVSCVALCMLLHFWGASIFSYLKWSQRCFTNLEESKEKVRVNVLERLWSAFFKI